MKIHGYRRCDGRLGIRNYVLILPTNICASDTAEMIARQVNGAVSFHNQVGCSQVPSDMQYALDMMGGFAANPNVYGTILVGLGCETCQPDMVAEEIRKRTNKPLEVLVIQKEGGTIKTGGERQCALPDRWWQRPPWYRKRKLTYRKSCLRQSAAVLIRPLDLRRIR